MKKLLATTLFQWCLLTGMAQTGGNTPSSNPYFVLSSFIPDQGAIQSESLTDRLKTRMMQITSSNGMGSGNVVSSRFLLVPKINVTQYENTATAPPKALAKMEFVLSIADAASKKVFLFETFKTTGIGKNNDEAYLNGVQNLPTSSPEMARFIETGKNKIVEYYNNNCDRILKDVQAKVNTQQFDAALEDLLSVPPEANSCFNKAMAELPAVFRQRQEFMCSTLLQQANASLAAGNEEQSALLLGQILPGTRCFDESQKTVKRLSDQHLMKYRAQLELQKDILRFIKEWAITDAANRPKIYTIGDWLNTVPAR